MVFAGLSPIKKEFMKYIFYLIFGLSTYFFPNIQQNRYLPVSLSFSDSSREYNKEIKLAFIGSFKKQQVKVISKEKMGELIKDESYETAKRYYESGGDLRDFRKLQSYASTNGNKVGTSIYVVMNINNEGIVNDTIRWSCRKLPMDMINVKESMNVLLLDSLRSNNLYEITDQVVEKIIASGELAQE